jgi:hypothetical protein
MKPKINPRLRPVLLTAVYALGIFGILASDSGDDDGSSLLCALEVNAIAPVSGLSGEVWVGLLAETAGATLDRVSRLDGNGREQVAVDITTGNGTNAVRAITIATDGLAAGDIYVGGDFSEGIFRLNPDGTLDNGFAVGTGFNGTVTSIVPTGDGSGDIYVGGYFSSYQGDLVGGLVRLNDTGTRDNGFIAIVPSLETVAMEGGGSTDVYGGGTAFPPLERWTNTGSVDSTPAFNPSIGINPVFVVAPSLDGTDNVYVGGGFPNRIIRLNQDGTPNNLFAIGIGFDDNANSIVRAEDNPPSNDIYVGGEFTTYNGAAANGIIRLDDVGTPVGTFLSGTGFSDPSDLSPQSQVASLAHATDGSTDLYVGGGFTRYNDRTVNGLVRLNQDGSLDTGFEVRIVVDGLTCDNDTARR